MTTRDLESPQREPLELLAMLAFPAGIGDPRGEFEFIEADRAQLLVRDLGVTRGDGIFETIGVVNGRAQALDAHLRRFAASARALDLPELALDSWRSVIAEIAEEFGGTGEVAIKIVCTRGVEGGARPTCWILGSPAPDFTRARRDGLTVATLDRGYRHDVTTTSPWLLQGAKTLSYAVNTAALREAARRGADEVIFVSSDGFVLEGPTSTVVYSAGGRLLTPAPSLPILAGTTSASMFEWAATAGIDTSTAMPTVAELRAADAVWLLSSVRMAAPVRAIDGQEQRVDRAMTDDVNRYLLARTT